MNEGEIKFFNEEQGYGFILDSNSTQEFFVHKSGLIDHVEKGDLVVFEVAEGNKGFQAVQVKKVEG